VNASTTTNQRINLVANYTLPDLPYDYSALGQAMSAEILQLHHDKHHAAYVKGANDTLDQLAEARDKGQLGGLVGLEKTLAFNLSGHVLHSIFWQNLSPDGGDKPDGDLGAAIDADFGSFDNLKAQLTTATTSVQGSGWGVLAWEPVGGRLLVEQVYDHHGNVGQGSVPVLVFDAWEHAYYLQYKNVRPDYVEQLWTVVNWADVAARLVTARTAPNPAAPTS
jgi:Fe-Mn family superoxide dismutase